MAGGAEIAGAAVPSRKLPSAPLVAFVVTVVVALGFALYTHHAWEDYWITYRASRTLAMGHGLVFNVGDRLHTFTSPLGVLLPAIASVLTANSSDAAALSIFRGNDWGALIRYLHPDWLVLRPAEIARVSARDSTLLRSDYAVAREFSVADAVGKLKVYGRLSLMSDARFTVLRAVRR